MRIIADIFEYTAAHMPKFNSISISGYHMQEAGATADIELAYTLADGLEYVRTGLAAGLKIDEFRAPAVVFLGHWHEPLHGNCQAARRPPALGQAHPAVQPQEPEKPGPAHPLPDLRLLASPSRTRSITWPARAIEALAAALGGTQSLHTNALDEAIALPTDFSARIARNTQLYLQHETDITRVVDPWGGSYYVETLTHELADKAWALMQEVEELGGMAKAIETGLPKMRIEEAAARKQARIDSGKEIVVGVNRTAPARSSKSTCSTSTTTPCASRRLRACKATKATRDEAAVQAALAALTEAAGSESKT